MSKFFFKSKKNNDAETPQEEDQPVVVAGIGILKTKSKNAATTQPNHPHEHKQEDRDDHYRYEQPQQQQRLTSPQVRPSAPRESYDSGNNDERAEHRTASPAHHLPSPSQFNYNNRETIAEIAEMILPNVTREVVRAMASDVDETKVSLALLSQKKFLDYLVRNLEEPVCIALENRNNLIKKGDYNQTLETISQAQKTVIAIKEELDQLLQASSAKYLELQKLTSEVESKTSHLSSLTQKIEITQDQYNKETQAYTAILSEVKEITADKENGFQSTLARIDKDYNEKTNQAIKQHDQRLVQTKQELEAKEQEIEAAKRLADEERVKTEAILAQANKERAIAEKVAEVERQFNEKQLALAAAKAKALADLGYQN